MIDPGEEIVFTTGAGQGGSEFGIGEGATQSGDATHHPQHDQDET